MGLYEDDVEWEGMDEYDLCVSDDVRGLPIEVDLSADLPKWKEGITRLIQNLDAQLSTNRPVGKVPDSEYRAYASWKSRTVNFRGRVMERLHHVRALMRKQPPPPPVEVTVTKTNNGELMLAELRKMNEYLSDIHNYVRSKA